MPGRVRKTKAHFVRGWVFFRSPPFLFLRKSIDFSKTVEQKGDERIVPFSFEMTTATIVLAAIVTIVFNLLFTFVVRHEDELHRLR